MTKAKEYVKKFSEEKFVCRAGWAHRFKLRHIYFGKVSGETRGVNSDTTRE
jgi:hypothetical protein